MSAVRHPVAAGRFYPGNAQQLRALIDSLLADAATDEPPPCAIIGPHAGYVYSGPVAASGYARLKPLRATVSRVVLIGPSHFVPVRGLAASSAEAFETPLGPVPVDSDAVAQLLELPQVQILDTAHADEHSLEVHLPFLQQTLGEFRLVPLAVGQAAPGAVTEVIEALWDGPETLVVVSSDLSHFHDYETAARLDRETSEAIEQMRSEDLRGDRACGFLGIGGVLGAARKQGLSVQTVDLRNSGDAGGPRDRVVGYGCYVVR